MYSVILAYMWLDQKCAEGPSARKTVLQVRNLSTRWKTDCYSLSSKLIGYTTISSGL